MGQYYKPVFLSKKNKPTSFALSYDFASGAKLMEHSWMGNDFVGFVERQLLGEPKKLVWAGDYADNEKPETFTKAEINEFVDNDYEGQTLKALSKNGINLYTLTDGKSVCKVTHNQDVASKYEHDFKLALPISKAKYLINYDKKEFVDKSKVPDNEGWRIHPLPLLTCEGNNRGGGDYRGNENNLVGRWSRDEIGVSPKKSDIPKDFKEILFDLIE